MPIDAWLRGPLRGRFEDAVLQPRSAASDLIDRGVARRLFSPPGRHRSARSGSGCAADPGPLVGPLPAVGAGRGELDVPTLLDIPLVIDGPAVRASRAAGRRFPRCSMS
ncbi:MAG: hypothetical protein U0746_16480 [Gemmataceae bacterium]